MARKKRAVGDLMAAVRVAKKTKTELKASAKEGLAMYGPRTGEKMTYWCAALVTCCNELGIAEVEVARDGKTVTMGRDTFPKKSGKKNPTADELATDILHTAREKCPERLADETRTPSASMSP